MIKKSFGSFLSRVSAFTVFLPLLASAQDSLQFRHYIPGLLAGQSNFK